MRKTPTLGTVIAVAEVDAPTWMGSNSTDTSEICTTTGGRGAMAEARFIGPTAMVDITAGENQIQPAQPQDIQRYQCSMKTQNNGDRLV